MLKVLKREEWSSKIENQRKLLFNEQLDVLEAIKHKHDCSVIYLIFEEKNKIVVSLIAFVRGKNIISPIHFFYSSLWVDTTLGDTRYCNIMTNFLRELRTSFFQISIRIPPTISDVRPFLWAGFTVDNRFTYVKDLDDLFYAKDVHKNIERSVSLPYVFKEEVLTSAILEINLRFFFDSKLYSKKSILRIKDLITRLSMTKYLTCFSCYSESRLLVSHILFVDEDNKIAYTVLKNKLYVEQKGSLHSALYHQLFLHLKSKGFKYVDLLGADMESISAFKSRFNGSLLTASVAKYSRSSYILNLMKCKLVNALKQVMAKFNV